jgi:hypothetical protein
MPFPSAFPSSIAADAATSSVSVHLAAATSVRAGLSAFVTYDKRLAAAGELGLPVRSPA